MTVGPQRCFVPYDKDQDEPQRPMHEEIPTTDHSGEGGHDSDSPGIQDQQAYPHSLADPSSTRADRLMTVQPNTFARWSAPSPDNPTDTVAIGDVGACVRHNGALSNTDERPPDSRPTHVAAYARVAHPNTLCSPGATLDPLARQVRHAAVPKKRPRLALVWTDGTQPPEAADVLPATSGPASLAQPGGPDTDSDTEDEPMPPGLAADTAPPRNVHTVSAPRRRMHRHPMPATAWKPPARYVSAPHHAASTDRRAGTASVPHALAAWAMPAGAALSAPSAFADLPSTAGRAAARRADMVTVPTEEEIVPETEDTQSADQLESALKGPSHGQHSSGHSSEWTPTTFTPGALRMIVSSML